MAQQNSKKGINTPNQGSPHSKLVAIPHINFQKPKVSYSPFTSSSASSQPTTKTPAPLEASDVQNFEHKQAIHANGYHTEPAEESDRSSFDKPSTTPGTDIQSDYNVYAAPYVPAVLKSINFESGHIVEQFSQHQIDFDAYIRSYVGSSFLLPRPSYRYIALQPSIELSPNTYKDYISTVWQVELVAKLEENRQHALYQVPLERLRTENDQELFAVIVPGLREDNPHVQMGDIMQLRMLYVDVRGNLVDSLQHFPFLPIDGSAPPRKHWTGVVFNASVYSTVRSMETVYLRMDGLQPPRLGAETFPLVANITIPLNQRSIEASQQALALIDSALNEITQPGGNENRVGADQQIVMLPVKPLESRPNEWIFRILFPEVNHGKMQTRLRSIPSSGLFDPQLNYEQAQAVKSISDNDYGTLPFLISGPPGTGKTKTMVETAMQLLNGNHVDHILICAPSDQAADTLAMRLKKYLNHKQLFRLNGPWRADNEVSQELMPYTYREYDMFHLPPFQQLMAYNIVITSCRDASILMDARLTNTDLWTIEYNMMKAIHPEQSTSLPKLHWGALLIDEAAQATELDVLPAISVVCPSSAYPNNLPQPRFVMAGDEHQLGPRTSSRHPIFSRSLFARLFERPLYKHHPLSRLHMKPSIGPPVLKKSMLPILYPPFANLIRNYRSHSAILSVPSSLFYNDTLIPEVAIPDNSLQHSSLWQGRKWPVLFVPNKGYDEIERDGGGWYNITEAHKACALAQTLLSTGLHESSICIMSPFAAQVKLLRSLLRSPAYRLWEINIGPLEAFQGLEKRVVIICTTRSRKQFIPQDVKNGLGIVHFPRKMNVAITRAMEGLIVIGNPEVLELDREWRAWMAFCARNGLVEGDGVGDSGLGVGEGVDKIGVLERALIAKEEKLKRGRNGVEARVLGGSAVVLEQQIDGEYEAFLEGLREALEDEDEDGEEDDDDLEEKGDGEDGEDVSGEDEQEEKEVHELDA